MLHHAYEVKAMFVSQLVDDSSKEWDLIREIAKILIELDPSYKKFLPKTGKQEITVKLFLKKYRHTDPPLLLCCG